MLAAWAASAWGGPLRYAEDRGPGIVNPLFATTMSEARLDELVFDGLFADDFNLESVGRLAESFVVADDLRSMTIRLRRDVVWHDGDGFDAQDVVFSINAYKDPATASSEAGRVSWITKAIAQDPYTVRLEFENQEYAPQDKLHFKILPSHRFSGTAIKRSDNFRAQPIGTGPFKLEAFDGSNITLKRNERRWTPAKLEGVEMREVSDKNYQARLLVYESLDTLVRVLPRELATLENDRKIELHPYQTNSWWYFGLNQRSRRTLSNAKIREAISLMVNVDQLLEPIGTGDRVSGPFVRSSPYYNHDVPPLTRDPDRGAELLTEAGYTRSGQGWVGSDGKPLTLKLVTLSNLETAQDVVINVQSQLSELGVAIEPEFLGIAEYRERVWRDHDFDIVLSQWSFDRSEDIYEQFHSSGSRNFIGYQNANVDGLLEKARLATDPQQKKALFRDVHARIAKDHPMVFLWTLDSYAALSTRVKNVSMVHPFYFFTWISDWAFEQ